MSRRPAIRQILRWWNRRLTERRLSAIKGWKEARQDIADAVERHGKRRHIEARLREIVNDNLRSL